MWIRIFLLISVSTITTRARIDGLQNDPGTGYGYGEPEYDSTSQASLVYYVNIPANQDAGEYFYVISQPAEEYIQYTSQYNSVPPQDIRGNSINQIHQYSQAVPEPEVPLPSAENLGPVSHFNPYEQLDTTWNNIYQKPYISSGNRYYNIPNRPPASNRFQQPTYQIDPRSRPQNPSPLPPIDHHLSRGTTIQKSIVETIPRSTFRNSLDLNSRKTLPPSQELLPPPYSVHLMPQNDPKPLERTAPKQYRLVPPVASLPMSINAQLPFPIGVVPLKFRPLPLKTHLRQGGLPPITSYQAKESYKK